MVNYEQTRPAPKFVLVDGQCAFRVHEYAAELVEQERPAGIDYETEEQECAKIKRRVAVKGEQSPPPPRKEGELDPSLIMAYRRDI